MVRALGIATMLVLLSGTAAGSQGEKVKAPPSVELAWTGLVGSWTPSGFVLDRIRPRSPAARILKLEAGSLVRVLTVDGSPLTLETASLLGTKSSASISLVTAPVEDDDELVTGPLVLVREPGKRRERLAWPEPSLAPAPRWQAVAGTPTPRLTQPVAGQAPAIRAELR